MIVCPTLGMISASAMILRRAISHTPRLVAFATSNRVVPVTVIGYRYSVVLRALELQEDEAVVAAARARAAVAKGINFDAIVRISE